MSERDQSLGARLPFGTGSLTFGLSQDCPNVCEFTVNYMVKATGCVIRFQVMISQYWLLILQYLTPDGWRSIGNTWPRMGDDRLLETVVTEPYDLCYIFTRLLRPGRFNTSVSSCWYRKYHCGDKTVLWPSYLHNGISYTVKTTCVYWLGTLGAVAINTFEIHLQVKLAARLLNSFEIVHTALYSIYVVPTFHTIGQLKWRLWADEVLSYHAKTLRLIILAS